MTAKQIKKLLDQIDVACDADNNMLEVHVIYGATKPEHAVLELCFEDEIQRITLGELQAAELRPTGEVVFRPEDMNKKEIYFTPVTTKAIFKVI